MSGLYFSLCIRPSRQNIYFFSTTNTRTGACFGCIKGRTALFHDFLGGLPDYAAVTKLILQIKKDSPFKIFSIGRSHNGREIYAFSMGSFTGATLYVGGMAGEEWFSSQLLYKFIEDLTTAYTTGGTIADIDVRKVFETRSLTIVPMLGVEDVETALHGAPETKEGDKRMRSFLLTTDEEWQMVGSGSVKGKEAGLSFQTKGDDLYKNTVQSDAWYRRLGRHEDAEIQAIAEFCLDYNFKKLLTFSGSGQEISYNYPMGTPEQSKTMGMVLAMSGGLKLRQDHEAIADGSLLGWFIQTFSRPALGIAHYPKKTALSELDLHAQYEKYKELLMLGVMV